MRLHVGVGRTGVIGSKRTRIQARNRFLLEVVRRLPAFVDEIPAQIEVATFLGDVIKAKEGQLDLRVAAVATNLTRLATETRRNVVGKTLRDSQEPVLSSRFEMNHRCFDQVSGAVEFVQISKVLESMLRAPGKDVAVDVAVRQLRPLEQADNLLNTRLQRRVARLLQACRGGFQPFREVGIPKDAAAPISRIGPGVGELAAPMHPPVEKHRIHLPLRAHFLKLVSQRGFSDEIAPSLPKSIREFLPGYVRGAATYESKKEEVRIKKEG